LGSQPRFTAEPFDLDPWRRCRVALDADQLAEDGNMAAAAASETVRHAIERLQAPASAPGEKVH
jgi:hypothetical protein